MISFRQTRFLVSASEFKQCPPDDGAEIAFCGRSNAGKSSAINALTGQRKLARTSRTPGRTQLINFFGVTDSVRLVDLPGFGYARVPTSVKEHWHRHLDSYLRQRRSLKGLVLLMDIRHPMKEFDGMMIDWSRSSGVPLHVLLTKADKLSRGAQQACLHGTRRELPNTISLQVFSATMRSGIDELQHRLNVLLEPSAEKKEP